MKKQFTAICNSLFNNRDIPRYLYFTALIIYVLIRTWDTTMYPRIMILNNLGLVTTFGLVGLKMLFYDGFKRLEIVLDVLVLGIGAVSYLHGGSVHFIFLYWFVMGAHDMDFQEIIKVYLIVVASVTLLAFVGTKLGIIEDLLYYTDKLEKLDFLGIEQSDAHALGGIYCTDTAARLFFWCLALFYVFENRYGFLNSFLLLVASYFVFKWTKGRLDSICLLILSTISFLDALVKLSKSSKLTSAENKVFSFLGFLSMPVAAVFSICAVVLYADENSAMIKLNALLSDRLGLGAAAMEKYSVNLFGHEMELVGFGGVELADPRNVMIYQKYNYVDISFIQILLMNGLLVLLIIVMIYMMIAWKHRADTYLMICICLVALNCTVAQHLLDISYVPFILALHAQNKKTKTFLKSSFVDFNICRQKRGILELTLLYDVSKDT